MSRYLIMFLALVALMVTFVAITLTPDVHGNGFIVTRDIEVSKDYKDILIEGPFKVTISQSRESSITLKTDKNLIPFIRMEVGKKRLRIRLQEVDTVSPSKGIFIDIKTPNLSKVTNDGTSYIAIRDLIGDRFSYVNRGTGDALISGKVKVFYVQNEGSGNIDAQYVSSNEVIVGVNGSGNVTVHPIETLEVEINGTSTVKYLGEPNIKKTIMGTGRVEKIE